MGMNPRTLRPTASGFNPRQISGLALWLDASDSTTLYTTDAGAVTAVSAPTEISGCVGWWDASDASTLFAADTGSTLATTTVGRWANKGTLGAAADLLQATSGSRPTTGAGTRNGLNVLSFDGTDDWMQRSFTLAQPCTVLIVFSYSSAYSSTTTLFDGAGTGNTLRFAATSNTDALFNTGNSTPQFTLSGWGTLNTWQQATLVASGAASASLARRNGLATINGSGTTGASVNPNGFTVASWGAFGLQYANAQYAEIVVFNSALSATDRARVEKYLADKWGISGVHAQATATNDPVGAWLDKSGSGRHATQGTAGNRPAVGSAVSNGRRGVNFGTASNSQRLSWVPSSGTQDWQEIFAVGIYDTAASTFGDNNAMFGGTTSSLNDIGWQGEQAQNAISYIYGTFARRSNINAIEAVDNALVRPFPAITSPFLLATRNTNNTQATGFQVGNDRTLANRNWRGRVCEVIAYGRSLTSTERARIARYLAAKWGITLAPQVSNADAQDWINRVYANGGTVSATTAAAVNAFCNAIDAASLRDRFYRLNLFCGTGLNACLVPLYRGPSLGGTQYGNTTDTNNGPFVSGDYVETGTSGGLQGNGSTKFLNTGLPMNFSTARNYHLSAVARNFTANNAGLIGADTNGDGNTPRFFQGIVSFNATPRVNVFYNLGTNFVQASVNQTYSAVAFLGSGNASGNTLYANGSSVGTDGESGAGTNANTYPLYVFAVNNRNVNTLNFANCGISAYSAGAHMTASQAAAYNSAMQAFQTALSRSV